MKRVFIFVLTFTLLLTSVAFTRLVSAASNDTGTVRVQGGTNVRKEPSSSSDIVGYIEKEADFGYSEIVQGWYKITLSNGKTGYVFNSRCKIVSSNTPVPTPTPSAGKQSGSSSGSVSSTAEDEKGALTLKEILAKYPGYEITDESLVPKEPKRTSNKSLYQNGCAVLPILVLNKDIPFLVLIMDAGANVAPNYITVETEYAVYDFHTSSMNKAWKGDSPTFALFDGVLLQMMKEITLSSTVKVTFREQRGGKGTTITLNESQLEILNVFYDAYNKTLEEVPNLANYALATVILANENDFKFEPKVTRLQAVPTPTVNPDAGNWKTLDAKSVTEAIDKTSEVTLHAGVRLGMGIREVVQTEYDAGNELYTASPNANGVKVKPSLAEYTKLPWGHLYYYGRLAGGTADSHANYKFSDDKVLERVIYFIRSTESDSKNLYDQIEKTMRDKYGEPVASSSTKTILDLNKDISEVTYKNNLHKDITKIGDYSQWIVKQADGSIILIEHIYQGNTTNSEYNYVNYVFVDFTVGTESYNPADDL